jgi:hypothetical protein
MDAFHKGNKVKMRTKEPPRTQRKKQTKNK